MITKLLSRNKSRDRNYKVGQIWKYETREGEENSTLKIVGVESHEKLGDIINVYVCGLRILNSNSDNKLFEEIQHLPFSKDAIDRSVIKLIDNTKNLPNFKEGYDEWRRAFDSGDAGIFTITVKESIEAMEMTINEGMKTN